MTTLNPFQLNLMALAGLIYRQQQQVIDYQKEENRILRELTGRRPGTLDLLKRPNRRSG